MGNIQNYFVRPSVEISEPMILRPNLVVVPMIIISFPDGARKEDMISVAESGTKSLTKFRINGQLEVAQ